MAIHDVTIPVEESLACWPGDALYRLAWTMKKGAGASVNVGQIALSVHTGTHVDAPFHFDDTGTSAGSLPLEPYVGPARVIHLPGRPRLRRRDIEPFDLSGTPRLLIRTDAWLDHTRFPSTIPVMEEDVPSWLHENGVVLIGLDVPSVDHLESKDLPNHRALGALGIAILESLDLSRVPEGVYELIALPLKLVGADGSPVRAVLKDLPTHSA